MQTNKVAIGLFVVSGLVLFGIGMFLIGDRNQAFAQHVEYYSEFVNLAGLAKGAKVRVGGMDAGQVVAIGVPDFPPSRFRVKWRIDAKLRGLVRSDSVATIGTEGIVGGVYLSVGPGSAQAAQAAPSATIPSKETSDLSALLAQGAVLLNDADGMLKEAGGKLNGALDGVTTAVSNVNDVVVSLKDGRGTAGMLLSDQELANQIRHTVTTASSDLDNIMADLKAGRGPAGVILRDEVVAGHIRDAVKNAQQATANLGHASEQADSLVSDLNSRQIPQRAGELVDNLNASAQQVNQLISDIVKTDDQGMTAGANVRVSLMNANTASSNLAESTEALKHNFLVRGFFRKRGYYNLADLTPETYRTNRAFINSANRRVWLTGAELFQKDSHGEEELSAAGKELLSAKLTEYGDARADSPIVIEGYWSGNVPGDQLWLSRSRATVVRQYLQAQLHIDARNLGVVPMKNLPLKGMDRTTWDGICIVILKRS